MQTEEIAIFDDKKEPMIPGKPIVERNVVHVIVINKKTNEVLCLDWATFNWHMFIVGGIEEGEDLITTAKREVQEEAGYSDIQYIAEIGKTRSTFYAAHKGENRIANATGMLFELVSDAQVEVNEGEQKKHTPKWIPVAEVEAFLNVDNQQYLWEKAQKLLS